MLRAAALMLVVVALAGCADDPASLTQGEPTFSDVPEFQPGYGLAPLEWRVVHESRFALTPATSHQITVEIPNGTVQAIVNLTLDAGASYGIRVGLGECAWKRDLALVATGQTVGADCGGVLDGASQLSLAIDAGALEGRAQVIGIVCDATQGRCPSRLPATTQG